MLQAAIRRARRGMGGAGQGGKLQGRPKLMPLHGDRSQPQVAY